MIKDASFPLPEVAGLLAGPGVRVSYRRLYTAIVDGKLDAERDHGRIWLTADQIEKAVNIFGKQAA